MLFHVLIFFNFLYEKILELYKKWKVEYNAKAEENVKKFLEK